MVQVVASNMSLQCLKNGADSFSGDDIFMTINGFRYKTIKASSPSGRIKFPDMFTGDKAILLTKDPNAPEVFGNTTTAVGNNTLTFKLFDEDSFAVDGFGSIPDPNDDFIGSTSYTTNGSEPLFEPITAGNNGLFFVNFMSGSGAQYKFTFNINRFPGSTTGKLASEDGGVLNGSNKDGTLIGQGGKDTIYANDGDDLVVGRGGNDKLYGGNGADLIFGGKGYDRVSGGKGRDTFVVAQKSGLDTITDFRVGSDTIGLASGLEYNDVSAWQKQGGTLLKAGSEKLAFLEGVKANQLGAQDFTQTNLGNLHSVIETDLAALQA